MARACGIPRVAGAWSNRNAYVMKRPISYPRFAALRHLLAGVLLALPGFAAAELPPPVRHALAAARIPEQHVALFVQAVDAPGPLLTHQATKPMNPASTMKLVTTYAALELLGPAHVWRTEAVSAAPPADGRLSGDLVLRGGGDPALSLEAFWLLLRQLRNRGLRDIGGDLILDRSRFALAPHDPGAFDGEPLRPYNAGPDALLVNLKSVQLSLIPEAASRTVRVVVDTPAAGLRIVNRLGAPGAEPCGDWREKLRVALLPDGSLDLSGHLPVSCGEKPLNLAPWPADRQVESLFRALWQELGGTFDGRVREARGPDTAQTLAGIDSPPLASVVREINKWSNNVMARQLLLALAPELPASLPAAQARVAQWLAGKGITGIRLDNGAGLSRDGRATADALGRLLLAAWHSPVMPELIASLPIAGVDGTLRRRLNGDGPAIPAHLKTGYLADVRALAGYVQDRGGRRWVVVGLIHDANARDGKAALDALVRWVGERK